MRLLADDVELALERVGIGAIGAARDEKLADDRRVRPDAVAERRGIDRHIAPAQERLALGGDEMRDHLFAGAAGLRIARQEHHADAIGAGLGQLEVEALGLGAEQPVGKLDQDAGAVARQRVGADRPAMREIVQNLDALG